MTTQRDWEMRAWGI